MVGAGLVRGGMGTVAWGLTVPRSGRVAAVVVCKGMGTVA